MDRLQFRLCLFAGTMTFLGFVFTLNADSPTPAPEKPEKRNKRDESARVPLAVAKDRAKLLHEVYAATLDSMHHHFFRRDRAVLPARAMDDVFADVDAKTKVHARWIAVNTPAMSVSHEAESAFEKKAVTILSDGKAEYEGIEKGYYMRATPIPLGAGCVGCHSKFGAPVNKIPRMAGLVISIPVKDE